MARLLLSLPVEILHMIASELPNSAIKKLRRTCSFASMVFRLRLNRVFLSPHQRDIDVFCEVARSETLRHQVVELVWDQNRFCLGYMGREALFGPLQVEHDFATEVVRFQRNRIANTGCLTSDDPTTFGESNTPLSPIAKTNVEILLRREANEYSNNDTFALEYNINRFPSLRRITISHSTNGWLFEPFYETPMIRSFPPNFMYDVDRYDYPIEPLQQRDLGDRTNWSQYSKSTRGYRAIFRALAAAKELQLEEVVIETPSGVECGLPFDFFALGFTSDYLNFVELLRRPHLRRFDLAITASGDIPVYDNQAHPPIDLLRDALREATSLTHFSFKFDTSAPVTNWVPLKALLPVDRWTNLQHFELFYFTVKQNDVANLLGELPDSVRSIELGFLDFCAESESHAGLLDEILGRAFWNERDEMNRPRLCISLSVSPQASRSIVIRLDAEIENFLYKQGTNPFRGSGEPNEVELGIGTERDTFNQCEWPRDQDLNWHEEIHRAHTGLESMLKASRDKLNRIKDMMDEMEVDVVRQGPRF